MRANSPQVVSVLLSLKADPDLHVRREAHQALISFGLAKPESENENGPSNQRAGWTSCGTGSLMVGFGARRIIRWSPGT